ncbi:DinB family protein [Mucilaginibacter lutimaris]|uniref:DinB family protein n=1 Tax=Mucilaginibacter lutimaris TaxID=931629 RepID=A0ABW2ZK46_9SPHI
MESTAQKLQASLQQILSHHPWYGPATYNIIDDISFDAAYETPPGSVHNIAGILLHMLGWAQEVTARMQGKTAGEPAAGDWPDPGQPDEDKWKQLVADFKLANVNLADIIQNFNKSKWDEPINDGRQQEDIPVTYRALIEGLIQHHIYHSGQIALLNRIAGGVL